MTLTRVVRWSLLLMLGLWGFFDVAPGDGHKFSAMAPATSLSLASEAQRLAGIKSEPLSTAAGHEAVPSAPEKEDKLPNAEAEKFLNCSLENLSTCSLIDLVVPGELVNLQPAGSIVVPLTGTIQFIATLINPHSKAWNVIGELLVKRADGTTLTLLAPRQIHLSRGQTLTLPVGLPADPSTFSPGLNEFIAILRDLQGNLIDQASVTFILTLDIKK